MRRDIFFIACALLLAGQAGTMVAQDIYRVGDLSSEDLNGTARFVGMGGALSALGADMSVMSTNPAGIGLFRSSDVSLTGGIVRHADASSFAGRNATVASFDQAGFVYAIPVGGKTVRFFNMGFNYHKKKNFHALFGGGLSGLDNLGVYSGISQSWEMANLAYIDGSPLDLTVDADGVMSSDFDLTTPVTGMGALTQMIAPYYDENGKLAGYDPSYAVSNASRVARWGGIQQYDFNFSTNLKERFYLGLTLSAYHVDWHNATSYGEVLVDADNNYGDYTLNAEESLTGSGFDVKFGLIVRPIEESAFRIGLSFTSPTFYTLTHSAYAWMASPYTDADGIPYSQDVEVSPHDYLVRTPWKFNFSLGHTIGNFLAIGAEYEYSNYATAKVRYSDGYDDYWYDEWSGYSTSDDYALNEEINRYMKGVSVFRIGAEARVADGLFIRAGYNYVSAPMDDEAYNNLFTSSPSYYYSVSTDYLNLGATNRYTAGIGYRGKHFYADVAYQFQQQDGKYYSFYVSQDNSALNALPAIPVKLNRHQGLLTIGYKF